MKRLVQVLKYGYIHAKQIEKETGKTWLIIYFDILSCFFTYTMWSNAYYREKFYTRPDSERADVGKKYREAGKKRELWQKEFIRNRKFIAKYSDIKYECGNRRAVRNDRYRSFFGTGKHLFVEYGVDISRQHYLDGRISIGDNVKICKGCLIDYSGEVIIGDNVTISERSNILSHKHDIKGLQKRTEEKAIPQKTVIKDHVWVGADTIILPGIVVGEFAVVGAGSVVTHDVEPYDIVAGNPAKSIKKI